MIRTRQTAIENQENSLSKSIFQLIETVSKRKTMNQISNIFESQIMKAIKVSTQQKFDYATLQVELNQFEQKRKRIELLKKIEKTKAIKIAEFFENKFVFLMNRIMIDEFQKKKLFKIMNSKKYKNAHSTILILLYENVERFLRFANIFILTIRIRFCSLKVFLRTYRRKIEKKHQKNIDIIFIS
jgi:activator of 2-hydroxyglutaryl-CoA dehydratase